MKAAFIRQVGAPSVIEYGDLRDPTPGPNDVLVRVGAVAVNPIDTYIRAGVVSMASKFPYVIGCDVAGTVEAVGASVARFQRGDRVWGSNQGLFGRQGTFSELASIDEKWLYKTPDTLTDQAAAAGALVGLTAHLGLFLHSGLRAGEVVFVNGGAGGVGSAVIQLAKAAGAKVIASAGREETMQLCRDLGADLVVNYRDSHIDDQIRAFALPHGGLQMWWETQRDPTIDRTVSLMAPRGRIVIMAGRQARPEFPIGPFYVKDLRLIGFAMFNATPDEQRAAADDLNRYATAQKWKPLIGREFPLSQAMAAHELQEANTLQKAGNLSGKIVLTPHA
ncbi:MAG: NADPH:quinone reductase [Planctomycetaceae bacterium]|nr:NADPH:quinone reductase [Planctomycetaceae bacterium]